MARNKADLVTDLVAVVGDHAAPLTAETALLDRLFAANGWRVVRASPAAVSGAEYRPLFKITSEAGACILPSSGRFVVLTAEGTDAAAVCAEHGVAVKRALTYAAPKSMVLTEAVPVAATAATFAALSADPRVEHAEPEFIQPMGLR